MVKEALKVFGDQINLTGDGGVMKKLIREGISDEHPSTGCKVSVHYTGKLTNGSKFDWTNMAPFEFTVDKGAVVRGFDLAVLSMTRGEKAVFTLQPNYAYGAAGSEPNIPPNATLIFELELVDWELEDLSPNENEQGILRHILRKALTRRTPNDGASVTVHLSGSYKERVFDERTITFSIGEIPDDEVIPGIQKALTHFGKGEQSRLVIKPEYAFGEEGNEKFKIPPNATVEYIVTLKEFERGPETWKLTSEESLEQAKLVKDKATGYLKQEKYEIAIKLYEKANTFLENITTPKPEAPKSKPDQIAIDEESKIVKAAVFLNIALCHLKLKNFYEARKACDTVLETDPKNVKAFYRRGTSFVESGDHSSALEDFKKAQELEPENKATKNQITICRHEIRKLHNEEKKKYANMFKKFADEDEKKAESNKEDYKFETCGEWNNDFVAELGGGENEADARKVLDDLNHRVVMI